ncbi:MAG TPA: cell division protein ZapA [Polyangiaceae bacterium]|jgi:cell division protein ZapA
MERRPIQLRVAGQTYKVVSTADEESLRHLAGLVDERVAELVPKGRAVPANAILLAAIALAHDLEQERAKRSSLERRARDVLRRVLMRIDHALELDPVDATAGAEAE